MTENLNEQDKRSIVIEFEDPKVTLSPHLLIAAIPLADWEGEDGTTHFAVDHNDSMSLFLLRMTFNALGIKFTYNQYFDKSMGKMISRYHSTLKHDTYRKWYEEYLEIIDENEVGDLKGDGFI